MILENRSLLSVVINRAFMSVNYFFNWVIKRPPSFRRFLLISIDAFLLPFAVWLSFCLRLANPFSPVFAESGIWIACTSLIIGLPLFGCTGQYKGLTRYVDGRSIYYFSFRSASLVVLLISTGVIFNLPMPPRSSWVLLWLLLTGFIGFTRFVLRDILLSLGSPRNRMNLQVAIYGAGEAGAQLAASLRLAGNYQIITFIDDSPELWKRTINNIPINPPDSLANLNPHIDQVLLAIPSLPRRERLNIVAELQKQDIPVLQTPSVKDIVSGRAKIDALRPVAIEDLLGRDSVPPVQSLLGPSLRDAVVCVTGAGGSIGSELCRQILPLFPKKLVLLENSEPSLYLLDQELRKQLPHSVSLLPVLGSAADYSFVERLFFDQGVQIVFHAAAYKHVPLVEANPLAGLSNNVGSTRVVCNAAASLGLREVVLISTDKAVRPTNVMGASKRLAELVLQASALEADRISDELGKPRTRFAMVRFGNVLGSSGSVVPLFRRQIATGGPITLTHLDVIRYFMTISEAAQLVLQSATLAEGGDVFLLDMGEPVRIKDLAELMVRLSGLSVRDSSNPSGDIDIICTGLRPGEKLYEELLIDAESEPTQHPLIYRARDSYLTPQKLWPKLDSLEAAISGHDKVEALALLAELVPEWEPAESIAKN